VAFLSATILSLTFWSLAFFSLFAVSRRALAALAAAKISIRYRIARFLSKHPTANPFVDKENLPLLRT